MMETQKDNNKDFIYPIPFHQFLQYRQKQTTLPHNYSIHEFKKLKQLKKMLQQTQTKIQNRIRLFKRVSIDLNKKKALHNNQKNKKNDLLIFQANKENRSSQSKPDIIHQKKITIKQFDTTMPKKNINSRLTQRNYSECNALKQKILNTLPNKVEQVYEQKMQNARIVKDQKEKNKKFLNQRKIKEMRQKIQSANLIRKARNRAVETKLLCQQEKLREVLQTREQKFRQQMNEYQELQCNLKKLQREERDALLTWKRTIEEA